nr:thermonuclease family protein [Bradyrhizobium sp. ARR65]
MSKRATPLLLILLLFAKAALAADIVGQASIIDGNTLEIQGIRIYLWGIDAPESTQLCRGPDFKLYRCGANAANQLDGFIAQRPVRCSSMYEDQYGRTVATCFVGSVDLGEWLVSNGLALDWPNYSGGRYRAAEREADRSARGIWAGSYVAPWLYRACIRSGGKPADCSDDANAHP